MNLEDEGPFNLPNGKKTNLDELINIYKEVSRTPLVKSANLFSRKTKGVSLKVNWTIPDIENNENIVFKKYYDISYDEKNKLIKSEELTDFIVDSNELASIVTNDGNLKVCVRKTDKNSQKIEVWNQKTKIKTIDIESTDHGLINLNPRIFNFCFSPNEKNVLYVAEKKTKNESFFKENLDHSNKNTNRGNEFEYKESWGEQFVDFYHTCICVLSLENDYKIKIIELPKVSLAQPFWISDETIGFIGYEEEPKRYGLVYCYNRTSNLYKCNYNNENSISLVYGKDLDLSLVNPQINSRKNRVFFLENPSMGPHIQAFRVKIWDLSTNLITTIFDQNQAKQPIKSLFVMSLPQCCWSKDDEHVVLNTIYKSKNTLCVLNIKSKKLKIIDFNLDATILNFENDFLVVKASSPVNLPSIFIGKLDLKTYKADFFEVTKNYYNKDNKYVYEIYNQNDENSKNFIQSIVIGNEINFNEPTPAIVIPHGGPHSAFTLEYQKRIHFFARIGFKCVLINYRGGLGIDNNYVKQLTGNVGDYDCKDCISVIDFLISLNLIDKNKITLYGGSHGGFLVTHLIGQYSSYNFNSCVAINPVTDISKMFGVSDIPDWCLIEVFGSDVNTYKELNNWPNENSLVKQINRLVDVGKPEVMKKMFEKSPINHIDNVKAPLLMVLGKVDKRVPYYQGLCFYNILKSKGLKTKCLFYEDNHNLLKTCNDSDFTLNAIKFILENLKL